MPESTNDLSNLIDDTVQYVKSFIKDKNVGSVTPTSPIAVNHICNLIDFSKDIFLVEYGAGNGVFTREILSRMTPASKLLAFETNVALSESLKKIEDKRLMVSNQSAEDVLEVSQALGHAEADVVLSGIPFSFFKPAVRTDILKKSRSILRPGGTLLVYQASLKVRPAIKRIFGNCETDKALLNLPPLFVMISIRT